jgi:hypothetical protein
MRAYTVLPLLSSLAAGLAPPNYPGFQTLWSDDFPGNSGDMPNRGNWEIVTG